MEDTTTLAELLRARPLREPARCVALIEALLDALEPLHARGQLQHAFHPRKIRVRVRDDAFQVVDLGPRGYERPSCTSGELQHDLLYVSPELVRENALDVRHDLHVLGIVLYQLVTGCYPFPQTTDIERFTAMVEGFVLYAPATSAPLHALAERMLSVDRAHRPASIAETRSALRAALTMPPRDDDAGSAVADLEAAIRERAREDVKAGGFTRDALVTRAFERVDPASREDDEALVHVACARTIDALLRDAG